MPFALLIFGIVLIVAGYRGKAGDLFGLLKNDLSPSSQFWPYIIAILVIGALGYVKPIRPIANSFLALVIVVMFLSNKGFFGNFNAQVLGGGYAKNLFQPLQFNGSSFAEPLQSSILGTGNRQ